jgi:hypothetical protein
MKTLNRFLIRLRNLVTGRRGDQRLREELEDYVARNAEANIQAGMSEEEARRQARMKLDSGGDRLWRDSGGDRLVMHPVMHPKSETRGSLENGDTQRS